MNSEMHSNVKRLVSSFGYETNQHDEIGEGDFWWCTCSKGEVWNIVEWNQIDCHRADNIQLVISIRNDQLDTFSLV